MKENLMEKELTHIQMLRLASPKLPGERPGAYDRRLIGNEKAEKSFNFQKEKALNEKKIETPKNVFGKMIEKVFVEPFQFVVNKVNKLVDLINTPAFQEGNLTVSYPSAGDEKAGTNGFYILRDTQGCIILFAKLVMQKKYIATINWKGSKADKTAKANAMITSQAISEFVTVPGGTITALRLLATNYGSSTPGTEEATFTLLNNGLIAVMFLFQTYANANYGTASDGIKSGGFDVKTITPRGKQPWSAVNSVVQGTIDLTAAGAGANKGFHEWLISYDGINFERMLPTTAAHTQVTGLAGGIEVWFMHQVINSKGPQGFDLVIQITVNR